MTIGGSTQHCQHCGRHGVTIYSRRLCWRCYYQAPGVREMYPMDLSRRPIVERERGDGRGWADITPPWKRRTPKPTGAVPGSEEKIRVLTERLWKGYHMHNPADEKCTRDGSGTFLASLVNAELEDAG